MGLRIDCLALRNRLSFHAGVLRGMFRCLDGAMGLCTINVAYTCIYLYTHRP